MPAPLQHLSFRKVILLYSFIVVFSFYASLVPGSASDEQNPILVGRRRLVEKAEKTEKSGLLLEKKSNNTTTSSKNQTKLLKPNSNSSPSSSSKNQTKLVKAGSGNSSKNQTKLLKPIAISTKNKTKISKSKDDFNFLTDSSERDSVAQTKIKLKKLNSTSKASDSTKSGSISSKKSSDLVKSSSNAKNKTAKSVGKSEEKLLVKTEKKSTASKQQNQKQPSWMYDEDEEDLVSGFKDLPTKFQKSIVPDLHRISTNSKIYLSQANKEFTKGFKPYVGNKYAPAVATGISCAFIIIPLLLVSLVINRIKAYFSLQKIVIFIQIYLSIYFSILCLSSLITGLEPLRFFYATSQSTYVWLQVLQTLGYVLYLLMLLMYLILVFSTESGLGSKFLGLAQTFVGFAVGLHYYMTVFHRVVLREPPKTNWKVHGIYALCFLVICLLGNAERRKKAYLEDDGEEGKKN